MLCCIGPLWWGTVHVQLVDDRVLLIGGHVWVLSRVVVPAAEVDRGVVWLQLSVRDIDKRGAIEDRHQMLRGVHQPHALEDFDDILLPLVLLPTSRACSTTRRLGDLPRRGILDLGKLGLPSLFWAG